MPIFTKEREKQIVEQGAQLAELSTELTEISKELLALKKEFKAFKEDSDRDLKLLLVMASEAVKALESEKKAAGINNFKSSIKEETTIGNSKESTGNEEIKPNNQPVVTSSKEVNDILRKYGFNLTLESLSNGLPMSNKTFFKALLIYMKTHPREMRLPRNGIRNLIGNGINATSIGDVYDHAVEVGLLEKEGRLYYVTDLIDKVAI